MGPSCDHRKDSPGETRYEKLMILRRSKWVRVRAVNEKRLEKKCRNNLPEAAQGLRKIDCFRVPGLGTTLPRA
jgi:hypothetical protein